MKRLNLLKASREAFGEVEKQRLMKLRKAPTVERLEGPTRPDRARRLGYKAKQGFTVVRVRVRKGKRKRPKTAGGRRPKRAGRFFTLGKSKQQVAEEKASRKFPNTEAVNSYLLTEDGEHKWFEVIMADRSHPAILKDRERSWVSSPKHKGRAFRGLTSAGRKARGLRNKGKGAEK